MEHKTVVIYHANCPDGFGAAWSAWRKFGDRAKYIAQEHHTPPPDGLDGADVYLLDFCFPKNETENIVTKAKRLTIVDHHITAKSVVESVGNHLFDVDHSGAVLAWRYFRPRKKPPKLLLHVEDVDLWKFKLKSTPEIISALGIYPMNFKEWNKLSKDIENQSKRKKIIGEGKAILSFKKKILQEMVDGAAEVEFEGYKCLLSSCPSTIHSELGNAMVKKMPPLAIVYRASGDKLKVSLRSDGAVDVAKIAEKYGGGGHKAAAGFQVNASGPYPWHTIKNF